MSTYERQLREETDHLAKTLVFLQEQLDKGADHLVDSKRELIKARQDMWENTAHTGRDFTKITEMNQYLNGINSHALSYLHTRQIQEKYTKLLESPYFGRFDLTETGSCQTDQIYIGYANAMYPLTHEVYVYDWWAPISSIFYRYELGPVSYLSPVGTITGQVSLKRQYKIRNSELQYFFDCSLCITDELLQDVLSRNSSPRMRNIVETIQRDQDLIIRDTHNQLLLVQGTAGSGKTSIALHRIAYLLYHGQQKNISSKDFLILSPNAVFSQYISGVLPELGEAAVQQYTYDEINSLLLGHRFKPEKRSAQLERLYTLNSPAELELQLASADFKGSGTFKVILERCLKYYARELIPFTDASYGGIILETKQQLKNRFLNNKIELPLAKQLQRIEQMLLEKVRPFHRRRLERLERIVTLQPEHQLEIRSFSRLLAIKEMQKFVQRLQRFTLIDYGQIYQTLFTRQEIFYKLAQGLPLPQRIQAILDLTQANLLHQEITYEDAAALGYLRIKTEGSSMFPELKHVVIDEAQDYTPLQYEIYRLLFKEANYTILGDLQQSLTGEGDKKLYETILKTLNKDFFLQISLDKGYRSSVEITAFCQKILGREPAGAAFERHEQLPKAIGCLDTNQMLQAICCEIKALLAQGYESVAVICKTHRQSQEAYAMLKELLSLHLIAPESDHPGKGVVVISSYLAKGLEFDAVLVFDATKQNYFTRLDRQLLYVASTRALHRLSYFYTGEKSLLLPDIT